MSDLVTVTTLSQEKVEQSLAILRQFLTDEYPSLNLTKGSVLHELVLRMGGLLHALNNRRIEMLLKNQSIAEIEADPTIADSQSVDNILSNFNMTRDSGTVASGTVAVVVSVKESTVVPQNTTFAALGVTFILERDYIGVVDLSSVATDGDRIITERNDGTFEFTVPVTASSVGASYNITKDTRMTPNVAPNNFIDAYATESFSGGTSRQSNADLINQFKTQLPTPAASGRGHIHALLANAVSNLMSTSIVGFGDPEMQRDRHNSLGMSMGGKADIYAVTSVHPETKIITLQAHLIDETNRIWQMEIGKDVYPGFYSIDSIMPADVVNTEGSLEITEDIRGLDLSGTDHIPDVINQIEGDFSAYQTAVVKFIDEDTPGGAGDAANYAVEFAGLPEIATLQQTISSRWNHNPTADYLVRAAVPIRVAVTLTIQYREGVDAPDVEAVKAAIASRVNSTGFNLGKLPASMISDACYDVIDKDNMIVVTPMDMLGLLVAPGAESRLLRDNHVLIIPDEPEASITPRTCVFFVDPNDIAISVEKVPTVLI